jgi:hypothetical protein
MIVQFRLIDRAGINRLKWILRSLGASKRYAGWVVQDIRYGGIGLDCELPNGKTVSIRWDIAYNATICY